jgi:hypothetical protein
LFFGFVRFFFVSSVATTKEVFQSGKILIQLLHFFKTQLSQERDLDLKQRIGKLLDILAVAYHRLEKLFPGRSVEVIRSEVERLAGSSHILSNLLNFNSRL